MWNRIRKLINSIYRLVVILKGCRFDVSMMLHIVKQRGCYIQEPELKKLELSKNNYLFTINPTKNPKPVPTILLFSAF